MTEIQSVAFGILKEFINVCEKLGLQYYLVCGSALGAVKYKGFIPWDDDIDVALPRKDYQVFCENAHKFLPEYYFIQTYKTDPEFPTMYCKVRDSRTTFLETSVKELNINHGIYIDVFPLDGYPKSSIKQKILEKRKRINKLKLACAFYYGKNQSLKSKIVFKLFRAFRLHKRTNCIAKNLERILSRWEIEDSDLICNHGNWQGVLEYAPSWHYGKGAIAEFEGLQVVIPENYNAYLTQKYGAWQEGLPIEEQQSHHYCEICDTKKTYIEYLNH